MKLHANHLHICIFAHLYITLLQIHLHIHIFAHLHIYLKSVFDSSTIPSLYVVGFTLKNFSNLSELKI